MTDVDAGKRQVGDRAKRQARDAGQEAKDAGREAAHSRLLEVLGRFGLFCRGVLYLIVGGLAVQIAFGNSGQEADSGGALRTVAGTPAGSVLLWLLAVGFAGMALWQLAEALFGGPGEVGHRIAAGCRIVVYGALCVTTVSYVVAHRGAGSSDARSQDVTARLMHAPGGRLLVGAAGVALVVGGAVFVVYALRRHFARRLDLSAARPETRRAVEGLGLVGNAARGVVCGVAGVFVLAAAVTYDPQKAKGVDGSLRSFADTPFGPWLLVAVAAGLLIFGLYSFCAARWQEIARKPAPHSAVPGRP